MVFVPEGKITQPANWKIPEVRGKVSNNKSSRERNYTEILVQLRKNRRDKVKEHILANMLT